MPAMTVQSFTVKTDEAGNPKKDNYGNTQMMIKFAESPETVYKAVKDPASITEGKVMYGQVQESQYGWKFVADPFNQPGQAPSRPYQAPAQQQPLPVADNETKELLLAIYKAVTGDDYVKVQKETTLAVERSVEPNKQPTLSGHTVDPTVEVVPAEAYGDITEEEMQSIPFN